MAKISNIKFLPTPLESACAVTKNNQIYFFGGRDSNGDPVDTIFKYDIASDTYIQLNDTLPSGGYYGMKGIAVGNYIYLFGGIDNMFANNSKIYSYQEVSGITDTGYTTQYTVDEFCLEPEGYNLILLTYNYNYECINFNTDWTIQSIYQISDLDDKLGTIHNWVDLHYYYAIKNNKIYMYDFDDTNIGDEIDEVTIPTVCGYCRLVVPYTGYTRTKPPSYLLFTKVNGSYTQYNIYRFDVENRELVRLRYMETQLNDFSDFACVMGNVDNIVYTFGGTYQMDFPTDVSLELDFRYPEIYISYNATYMTPSNQTHYVERGNNYNVALTQRIINNAYVDINIDHVYYGNTDVKDDSTKCIIDDRSPLRGTVDVGVKKIYNDIYIVASYVRFHKVNILKSEGVTFSNTSKQWIYSNDWVSTITLKDHYSVVDFKITDYLGNDIKNYVYDDATKTITLNRTDWSLYRNVDITLIADATDVYMTLYQNTSNERTVDKSLIKIKEVTGYLRDETSITNPSIIIDTSGEGNYILNCNYVYIENLQRYYYIRSIDFVRKNLWRINLRIDVLMSYKDKIRDMRCLISRASSEYYSRIPDSEVILASSPIIDVEEIPNDVFNLDDPVEDNFLITALM